MDMFQIFVNGDEHPGLMFYGLDTPDEAELPRFPSDEWPNASSVEEFILGGESWRVCLWEVALVDVSHTPGLAQAIDRTLTALLSEGCAAAWLGTEGHFCDPPNLFLPECMSGGIFALATAGGTHWNSIAESRGLRAVPDELLLKVRAETIALASAES